MGGFFTSVQPLEGRIASGISAMEDSSMEVDALVRGLLDQSSTTPVTTTSSPSHRIASPCVVVRGSLYVDASSEIAALWTPRVDPDRFASAPDLPDFNLFGNGGGKSQACIAASIPSIPVNVDNNKRVDSTAWSSLLRGVGYGHGSNMWILDLTACLVIEILADGILAWVS